MKRGLPTIFPSEHRYGRGMVFPPEWERDRPEPDPLPKREVPRCPSDAPERIEGWERLRGSEDSMGWPVEGDD